MLKQSILVITSAILLTACNGGGGGSSSPAPTPNQVQPLSIHVSSTYSAGQSAVGDIIDARPFATATKFTVTFTNPYANINITQVIPDNGAGNESGYSRKIGVGESGLTGYLIGAAISTSTCSAITESTPLLPGQSCSAVYYTSDMFNFSDNESLILKLGYEYRDPTHGRVMKYGIYTGNEAQLPVLTGIIYTKGQGYDFNNNQVATLLMTTESGQDYMYLNSGQKLKMSYDATGKPILDFANNVVPCTNTGCSNGLVPSNLLEVLPWSPYTVGYGSTQYGVSGWIIGRDQKTYGKNGYDNSNGLKIPNVNYIYAVQPDGTIFGQNSNTLQWGCFNNDGSNFRAVTVNAGYQLPESQIFNYGTTTLSYSYYGNTNWVKVGAGFNPYGGGFDGRVIASTAGDCIITQEGSLASNENYWFQQQSSSTGSANYGNYITQQPLQITSNGVFGYYIYQYGQEGTPTWMNNTPHFMFYKYPPRE